VHDDHVCLPDKNSNLNDSPFHRVSYTPPSEVPTHWMQRPTRSMPTTVISTWPSILASVTVRDRRRGLRNSRYGTGLRRSPRRFPLQSYAIPTHSEKARGTQVGNKRLARRSRAGPVCVFRLDRMIC
jgi:hypothetical protein